VEYVSREPMSRKKIGMVLLSLVIATVVLAVFLKQPVSELNSPIEEEEEQARQRKLNPTYVQVELDVRTNIEANNSLYRVIWNNNNHKVYNVTLEVYYHYENDTYRGYTIEVIDGPKVHMLIIVYGIQQR